MVAFEKHYTEGTNDRTAGLDAIGRRVGQMLFAFACRVTRYDLAVDIDEGAKSGVEWLEGNQVIRRADFLSLHISFVPANEKLLNRERI